MNYYQMFNNTINPTISTIIPKCDYLYLIIKIESYE